MSNPTSLRPAAPLDCQTLTELALRSKAHWGYSDEFMRACAQELEVTPDALSEAESIVVACTNNNQIAGYYSLIRESDTICELDAMFVDPGLIGQGIGKLLMQDAKVLARERGFSSMVIQSDPFAVGFYQANGAYQTGTKPSDSIGGRELPLLEIAL